VIGEALAPLWGAALTIAACYAAGTALISRLGTSLQPAERFPLAFVLGAACLHLTMFTVFALKIATRPVLFALAIGVIGVAIWNHVQNNRVQPRDAAPAKFSWTENPPAFGYAAIFIVFTVLYFITAWAPEASADGSGYHLELISRYLDAHGFFPITTNLYAGFAQGAEMLYAMAFSFGGHAAPAVVHLCFAVALAFAMLAYGIRIGKWWVGAAAALLVYVTPVVGKDASAAYIDVASAAIAFCVFYWLEVWDESRDDRALIAVGLLAGYAFATKLTGGALVPYALVFAAWRSWKRREGMMKRVLLIGVCAAWMMSPWLVKNWIYLGDPIFPFGASVFRNPNMHVSAIEEFVAFSHGYRITDQRLPVELFVRGDVVGGFLGPVFLALPLALLSLRNQTGRRLLLAGAVVMIPFFANLHARFLIPVLPFLSIAMILPLSNLPRAAAALAAFHALASWPPVVRSYINPLPWTLTRSPLAAALRRETQDGYLRRTLPGYPQARLIEAHVPEQGRVFAFSGIATSYTSREVLVGHMAALNQNMNDALVIGWDSESQPRMTIVFRFAERALQRIRIVQTARLPLHQQWGVHELRYYRGGVEIPRSPAWRLHASPNPWEVQFAFDNSPATRWRTWETALPGMYIETDFGTDQRLDEVRVETSRTDRDAKLQVETFSKTDETNKTNEKMQWVKIASDPEQREVSSAPWFRRAATDELHARGVEYLLIQDRDFGAADFDEDPESWGLEIVARESGMTIYKITAHKVTP
jgi:hypothetical protein